MEDLKNIFLRSAFDPVLRVKSALVGKDEFDETSKLLVRMEEIMRERDGIGIAAPQVGILKRAIIIDRGAILSREDNMPATSDVIRLINPEIVDVATEDCTYEEGCLSLPTVYANISRPEWVKIEYLDERGERKSLRADKLFGRCILHEMDHLEGKLFIDYLSSLRRHLINSKLAGLEKGTEE
jgi:peptide deformylase